MLDRLVHTFNLSIGLRLCDQREDLLDLEGVVKLPKFIAIKLGSIFRYDGVGDSVVAYDVLVDELLDLCRRDRCKRFCFNPFSEVVNNHYCVLHTTSSFGKSVN